MLNSYQILALKIRRNFYEGKKLENCSLLTLSIPILSAKNLKEKFAKLFLTEIQKNRLPKTPIFSLPPLIQTKVGAEISGEKWRYFYKEFHLLAKNEESPQIFIDKHYAALKTAQKSIELFSSNTRSIILALSWYLKKENLFCLFENYQYLNQFFKKKKFSLIAMTALLKIKYKRENETCFFHHGLGSLDRVVWEKILFFYLENKKKIYPLLLTEKKFIQFCRYTDNYLPKEIEGFFINLKFPLQKIYEKYFSHHPSPPKVRWEDRFNCRKLASYNFLEDKISISPIFDLPKVDPEVIEYLLYHEMLHRELGFKISKEKIYVHTKEFKKKEAQIFDLKKIDKKIKNHLNLA